MRSYQEIFNESFARTVLDSALAKKLLEVFLQKFASSSERIERRFQNLEPALQLKILHSSVVYMSTFATTGYQSHKGLKDLAEQHRMLGIQRVDFQHWLESLVASVAEVDPLYKAEVGDAWRIAMAPGIAYMLLKVPVTAE